MGAFDGCFTDKGEDDDISGCVLASGGLQALGTVCAVAGTAVLVKWLFGEQSSQHGGGGGFATRLLGRGARRNTQAVGGAGLICCVVAGSWSHCGRDIPSCCGDVTAPDLVLLSLHLGMLHSGVALDVVEERTGERVRSIIQARHMLEKTSALRHFL